MEYYSIIESNSRGAVLTPKASPSPCALDLIFSNPSETYITNYTLSHKFNHFLSDRSFPQHLL